MLPPLPRITGVGEHADGSSNLPRAECLGLSVGAHSAGFGVAPREQRSRHRDARYSWAPLEQKIGGHVTRPGRDLPWLRRPFLSRLVQFRVLESVKGQAVGA